MRLLLVEVYFDICFGIGRIPSLYLHPCMFMHVEKVRREVISIRTKLRFSLTGEQFLLGVLARSVGPKKKSTRIMYNYTIVHGYASVSTTQNVRVCILSAFKSSIETLWLNRLRFQSHESSLHSDPS